MKKTYFLILVFAFLSFMTTYGEYYSPKSQVLQKQPLQLPYFCPFATQDDANSWTIINSNNSNEDGIWAIDTDEKAAIYTYDWKSADDWLISPSITLNANSTYRISFDTKVGTPRNPEHLKVYYGLGATVQAQKKNLIADYPDMVVTTYQNKSILITPEVSGEYNVGFYACSEEDRYLLYVTNVSVEQVYNNDLAALSLIGPASLMQNKLSSYTVNVKNNGNNPQDSYNVQLIKGDIVLAESEINESIEPNQTKAVVLQWTPTEVENMELKGKVILDNDEWIVNNQTSPLSVNIQPNNENQWAIIGTKSDSDNIMPINFFYKSSATQTIYLRDEIGYNGIIKKIVYPYNNQSGKEFTKSLKIYMGTTPSNDISDGWIAENKLKLVFEGNVSLNQNEGEIEIILDTPFIYSSDNLCIMVTRPKTVECFNDVSFFMSQPSSDQRTLIYRSDFSEFNWTQTAIPDTKISDIKLYSYTANGGKIEGIVKYEQQAIAGADVTCLPIGITTKSDANGVYKFNYVPSGSYQIIVSKFGFENFESDPIDVSADITSTVNVNLDVLHKYSISGSVKDMDNNNLSGCYVSISGYVNFETATDDNGFFVINNLYKSSDYFIKVRKTGFATYTNNFVIDNGDVNLQIELPDIIYPPTDIIAEVQQSKAIIKWNEPSKVFRYDDGVVSGHIGWDILKYPERAVVGCVHKTPAVLTSMSWWTEGAINAGGPHNTVNVFVLDLDEKGYPTTRAIFNQMHVPNVDDQWSTFTFPEKVECPNGFMIAISYEGFVGIGIDSGTSSEWPFVPNGSWYSSDYTQGAYVTLSPEDELANNCMIRAKGDIMEKPPVYTKRGSDKVTDLSMNLFNENIKITKINSEFVKHADVNQNLRSVKGFKVWKLDESDKNDESLWTLLTASPITSNTFEDNNFATYSNGMYMYAVKAVYNENILSDPAFSNAIPKGMETTVNINVNTNTQVNASAGAHVRLVNNDNDRKHIYDGFISDGKITFNKVWRGSYKLMISLENYVPIEVTDLDLSSDDISLSYQINEIKINPFDLEISQIDDPSKRRFDWQIDNFIEDGFEGHNDFAINSSGRLGWSYIDDDEGITMTYNSFSFPNQGSKMAYMVFNPMQTTPAAISDEFLKPYQGNKYLVSFPLIDDRSKKDYLISPELSYSNYFTLSFYAKSYIDYSGLERIKVAYSTTGKDKSDFTNILTAGKYDEVPATEWTKFSYTVPASAKYLTIECISESNFIYMMDNISIGIKPEPVSYEIYLNGNKVDESLTGSYIFTDLKNGDYIAGVKAIYKSGTTDMVTKTFNVDNVQNQYKVSFNAPLNGTLQVKNGEMEIESESMVARGTILRVIATADKNYEIDTLTANGISVIDNSVIVNSDVDIKAVFKKTNSTDDLISEQLNIYPNPVHDILNIEGYYNTIDVFNAQGKKVLNINGDKQINFSDFANGIYILKIMIGDKTFTYKVIK